MTPHIEALRLAAGPAVDKSFTRLAKARDDVDSLELRLLGAEADLVLAEEKLTRALNLSCLSCPSRSGYGQLARTRFESRRSPQLPYLRQEQGTT